MTKRHIAVAGATGYIGGRLVPRLLDDGFAVRCLVRDPGRVGGREWASRAEVVRADVLDPVDELAVTLSDIETAFYLVHSMTSTADFHRRDIDAARRFAAAAKKAGVRRIVYLGGLGDPDADLSQHLRSRQETGRALAEAGVPVTEFRAAVVVGSGSISFEMIRYLTERLPVMVCPRWVYTRVQPIAVADVVAYLRAALDVPESAARVIEVGGADVLTYGGMMQGYARVRGLRRALIPVPVLTPRLSSYWVYWVTPVPAAIARPLIEGLRNEVVVRDPLARTMFPDIRPLGYEAAVRKALTQLESGAVESAWSDALASSDRGTREPVRLETREGVMMERRQRLVQASPERVFGAFAGIGGARGWPYADALWHLRGALDVVVGGVGLRRGRRDPDELRVGDALDFWRVEAVEPPRLLRLRAEMKVPGRAWLQFEALPQAVASCGPGGSASATLLVQTAYFAPRGLAGFLYWYGLYPLHGRIFSGMIDRLAFRAESPRAVERPGETTGRDP